MHNQTNKLLQNRLPKRQHDVLKAIHDFNEQLGHPPPYRNNSWLEEKTGHEYVGNNLTNIKAELKKLHLLTEDLKLTSSGKEYIRIHFGAFVVKKTEIRVQGKVRASPGEDLFVDLDKFNTPSEEIISIPLTSPDKETFALRVVGQSMTELGIWPGDFVIVESQDSLWWPESQDLIVAEYLPHDPHRNKYENDDPGKYIGPVIKVYLQRFGEKGCELGWRSNKNNPEPIKADGLHPIGKVKGLYREKFTLPLVNTQ